MASSCTATYTLASGFLPTSFASIRRGGDPLSGVDQMSGTLDKLRRKLTTKGTKANEAARDSSSAGLSPSYAPTRRPGSMNNNPFQQNAADAPPEYSAAPPPQSPVGPATSQTAADGGENNPFHFLRTFDTVFLIDDSGSMAGSNWRETRDALASITPTCTAYDADGIDIYFLNARSDSSHKNITSAALVERVFGNVRPSGATPMGQRLHQILKPYLADYAAAPESAKPKPMNLIVITDGVPTDDVEGSLIQAAKKLDKLEAPAWQVGVQFFQVGKDRAASEYLQTLDDELEAAAGNKFELRDMVDTVPYTDVAGRGLSGEGILKVVLGAVHRRQDRKKESDGLRR